MLLCGAEHPLYAKKMGQVPCLFSYLSLRRKNKKWLGRDGKSLRDNIKDFVFGLIDGENGDEKE